MKTKDIAEGRILVAISQGAFKAIEETARVAREAEQSIQIGIEKGLGAATTSSDEPVLALGD